MKEEGNYNALELTGNHKDIVKGLVQTHFAAKNKEKQSTNGKTSVGSHQGFDLVRAKGKWNLKNAHNFKPKMHADQTGQAKD